MTTIGQAVSARCARDAQPFVIKVRAVGDGWEAYDAQALRADLGASPGAASINSIPSLGGQYPGCPHCRAGSFFVCYGCSSLTCWDGKAGAVRCSWCGTDVALGATQPVDIRSTPWQ